MRLDSFYAMAIRLKKSRFLVVACREEGDVNAAYPIRHGVLSAPDKTDYNYSGGPESSPH